MLKNKVMKRWQDRLDWDMSRRKYYSVQRSVHVQGVYRENRKEETVWDFYLFFTSALSLLSVDAQCPASRNKGWIELKITWSMWEFVSTSQITEAGLFTATWRFVLWTVNHIISEFSFRGGKPGPQTLLRTHSFGFFSQFFKSVTNVMNAKP